MSFMRLGLCAALLVSSYAVSATDIQVIHPSTSGDNAGRPEVYLAGEITTVAVEQFKALVSGGKLNGSIIYMDSAGGDPQAGMNLGNIIRDHMMTTAVGRRGHQRGAGSCMSACVLAYAGGTFRFIDPEARLGIHRFYRKTATTSDLDIAQVMSAAITAYLIRMGIDPDLFGRMARVPSGGMQLLPHVDAIQLRLVNNGVLPARWAIEGKQGSVYLIGEQVTSNGTGKVIMTCAPNRKLRMDALYDADSNNAYIAKNATAFSLRINNRFVPLAHQGTSARVSGDYVVASFEPTLNMAWEISGAQQIGFGFHAGQTETFYGFLVSAAGQQDLVRSWVKHCTEGYS